MKWIIAILYAWFLCLQSQAAIADTDEAVEIDLDQLFQAEEEYSDITISENEGQISLDLGDNLLEDQRSLAAQLGDFSALNILRRERFGAARDLAGLLERMPGVDVRSLGGSGQLSTVTMRGASSGQVLVLLDGQPLSALQGSDLSVISIGMLERIEILRGPQTLQFGPGALGGVVNLVSMQPPAGTPHALSYAESGLNFKEYFHEQVLREFDNAKEDTAVKSHRSYAALAGSHGLAGLSLTQIQAGSYWSIGHSRSDNDYNFRRGSDESATRRNAGFERTELLGNWLDGSVQYRLGFSDLKRGIPGSAEFPTLRAHLDRQNLWLQREYLSGRTALSMQFSHVRDPEPYLNRGVIDNRDLLLHAEHEVREGSFSWRPRLDYAEGYSAGGQLRAGLDVSKLQVESWADWQLQYGAGLIVSSDIGIDPLASLALRRDFGESADAWASLSRAVRHPSFEELYVSDSGSVRGNPDLDPEIVDAIELGYRRSFARARLETSVFYSRYTDSIIFAPVSAYLVEARNTGRADIAGAEAQLDWQLADGLWWTNSASWLPLAEYASGVPLTGRSSLHATSALQYLAADWSVQASLDHSSSIPADLFGNLRTDPRSIVSVEIGIGSKTPITLAINNLFDTAARDSWNYPLPGREFSIAWSNSL